jgi:hypothetical protein
MDFDSLDLRPERVGDLFHEIGPNPTWSIPATSATGSTIWMSDAVLDHRGIH